MITAQLSPLRNPRVETLRRMDRALRLLLTPATIRALTQSKEPVDEDWMRSFVKAADEVVTYFAGCAAWRLPLVTINLSHGIGGKLLLLYVVLTRGAGSAGAPAGMKVGRTMSLLDQPQHNDYLQAELDRLIQTPSLWKEGNAFLTVLLAYMKLAPAPDGPPDIDDVLAAANLFGFSRPAMLDARYIDHLMIDAPLLEEVETCLPATVTALFTEEEYRLFVRAGALNRYQLTYGLRTHFAGIQLERITAVDLILGLAAGLGKDGVFGNPVCVGTADSLVDFLYRNILSPYPLPVPKGLPEAAKEHLGIPIMGNEMDQTSASIYLVASLIILTTGSPQPPAAIH